MRVLLFEDDRAVDLQPITLSRPAFFIACGSYRLFDLLYRLGHPMSWIVRPYLRGLVSAETAELAPPAAADADGVLLVNGALVPSSAHVQRLAEIARRAEPIKLMSPDGRVAAAFVPPGTAAPAHQADPAEVPALFQSLALPTAEEELPLFIRPHDVVREHMATLGANLQERLRRAAYQEIDDGVFVAGGVTIGKHVVTDTSDGPILIESDASIGPYTYLSGPVHVGPRCKVIEHSAIKDGVALGHTTKVGGEVEASVIEPYSNKQHHGFLGHSYLGSWINLGAGTCNSDLKNTYGLVNMRYGKEKVATGMQFLGCIMGDYSKSAINTSIFTGKVIGVCSMLYGFVTTNVPSFVNYARLFSQVTETPVEVMIAAQQRMFARRKVTQRPCDIQLLYDMYELTRAQRQLTGEPLAL